MNYNFEIEIFYPLLVFLAGYFLFIRFNFCDKSFSYFPLSSLILLLDFTPCFPSPYINIYLASVIEQDSRILLTKL